MMASPVNPGVGAMEDPSALPAVESTPKKKGRTNTPWTAEEEQRLKTMRDAGRSWSEIAKVRARPFFYYGRFRLLIWGFFLLALDFPYSNRGQCQEALVQGRRSWGNLGDLTQPRILLTHTRRTCTTQSSLKTRYVRFVNIRGHIR